MATLRMAASTSLQYGENARARSAFFAKGKRVFGRIGRREGLICCVYMLLISNIFEKGPNAAFHTDRTTSTQAFSSLWWLLHLSASV